MPVGASSFQISEVSQLEDETIGFYMKICDGKDERFITAKRANEDLQYITEVRFGTEEDYVLLWKTGMDLPKASERMKLDYTDADR